MAGGECSLCPQKGRGALGKVDADFDQHTQKALGSCPMSGNGGIKEQGFQGTVKCCQPSLPNFPRFASLYWVVFLDLDKMYCYFK